MASIEGPEMEPPTGDSSMPAAFVGHGSPMNAIEDNEFARRWEVLGGKLPRPRAILCVSAHWETWGTMVTAMDQPRTIHDFGGFPQALYEVRYPAPGSAWLAREVASTLGDIPVRLDLDWGLDHGTWSILSRMYPAADVPVVQLSLDAASPPERHYAIGRALAPLRHEGVLIVGSGNMVHNLRLVSLRGDGPGDFSRPFGYDWAIEAGETMKRLIDEDRHPELIDYASLGPAVRLAVPTPEHYLPMLYVLALKRPGEAVHLFNDVAVAGSLTMTSFVIS